MPIRAANAPVSWGIQEFVAPPADYPYSRVLDEISEAGYAGTELGPYGFLPSDPVELRHELEKRHLELCSAFVAMKLGDSTAHKAGFEHVKRSAELISEAGAHLLILCDEITPGRSAVAGRVPEASPLSWEQSEWDAAETAIREIIALCGREGLAVAFHHHAGTHVETPQEVACLLSLFSPDELGLCLDTGHYVYGGGDPVPFLEQHFSRIRCMHLKDVDIRRLEEACQRRLDFYQAVRHGVFVPLGGGVVPFSEIVSLLRERQYEGWVVVEQDVLEGGRGASTPLANARAGREFLRKLGI